MNEYINKYFVKDKIQMMKTRKSKNTYKLRPALKDKFRPAEFKDRINEI